MTISLSDNDPRISYTVNSGVTQTTFTVPFEFFDLDDLKVYVDGTLKSKTTHYTLASGGSGATGSITMSVTGAAGNSTVVITRSIALQRTTDFQTSGPFAVASLNTELDKIIAIQADLKDDIDRSLRLTDFDSDVALSLPDVDTRKGKTLAFNATTGAVESGPSISDVQTVSAAAADIAALADIEDGTTATDAISGLAAIKANVTTVAGVTSNVTTVAGISSNVTSVAGNASNINTVAGNNSNVSTVAGVSGDVTTVAGIASDVSAVAGDATDIGAVAAKATEIGRLGTSDAVADLALLGTSDAVSDMNALAAIVGNINTVSGVASNVSTVAGISANVTTVAGNNSNVSTVAGISSDVTSVAGIASNVTTVANDGTDIGTVAGISSNVTTVAGVASNVSTVAGISANVTSVAGKATEIGLLGTSSVVSNMGVLGTSDAVSDMNSLAAISSDITSLAGALEKTYTVTVTNPGSGNVFVLDGSNAPTISLFRGNTYIFDQSDNSNTGHPIAFKDSGGSAYTTGISSTGTPGSSGAKTTFEVASDAPSSLRYYCTVHGNGMGNTITVTDSNISLVAGSIANVNLTGGSISNVNSVASALTNINTTATNISGVNSFAERYRVGSSDPTSSLDEGDLAYNSTANQLKYYDGSAWQGIAPGISAVSGDSSPSLGGNLNVNGNSIVSASNANIAITPNGSGAVVLDGLSYPQADGSAGQFLKTDGSGSLSFATVAQPSNATTSDAGLMSAADKTKMDAIEASADVTDATNVAAAGAAMLAGASFTGAVDVDAALVANTVGIDNGSNDWVFSVSSNALIFSYGGTAKAKLDSSGNLTVIGNVTAYGSI